MAPRAPTASSPRCHRTPPRTPTTVRTERHGRATQASTHGGPTKATRYASSGRIPPEPRVRRHTPTTSRTVALRHVDRPSSGRTARSNRPVSRCSIPSTSAWNRRPLRSTSTMSPGAMPFDVRRGAGASAAGPSARRGEGSPRREICWPSDTHLRLRGEPDRAGRRLQQRVVALRRRREPDARSAGVGEVVGGGPIAASSDRRQRQKQRKRTKPSGREGDDPHHRAPPYPRATAPSPLRMKTFTDGLGHRCPGPAVQCHVGGALGA
jgi:hypothetical protein